MHGPIEADFSTLWSIGTGKQPLGHAPSPDVPRHPPLLVPTIQLVAEETEELLAASLAAMRANLQQTPAPVAPPPTDDFLLMFLRTEVFSPSAAADRYRRFWKVSLGGVLCVCFLCFF